MAFEITGKLIEKSPVQQVKDNFRKREFVIERNETSGTFQFTDYIKFQLTQDRCSLVDNFENGGEIRVTFNIRGNKWVKDGKTSYFTNLEAFRVDRVQGAYSSSQPQPPEYTANEIPGEPENDLPF